MNLDDIEARLKLAKEAREVERAIDLCERGARHNARISSLKAEDAAEAERSIELLFTAEESIAIFNCAAAALTARRTFLMTQLQ